METSDVLQIVRLAVEATVGGILAWLVVSLKSNWSAHKDLLEERIELLKAQMPAAQELAAKVEIHKELLEAEKTELARQLAQKDEAHRQELEQKLADIMALQEQIEKYEDAEQRRQHAEQEARRHARNVLAHGAISWVTVRDGKLHRIPTPKSQAEDGRPTGEGHNL